MKEESNANPRTDAIPPSPTDLDVIRQQRRHGALLGDLTRQHGVEKVVLALGIPAVAYALGIRESQDGEDDDI